MAFAAWRFLAATALTGAWLPALPAHAAHAFYRAETSATAIHATVTQQPASSLITASLFDDAVAYTSAVFDTGGSSEALAAPAFPGRLVVQGPELVCTQLFSCPAEPPAYPLLADASYPRRTHDRSSIGGEPMGAGPFVVTPLSATAHAGATANGSQTSAGTAHLLAGTPGAVDVRASSASSRVSERDGALHVNVDATLTGVRIGGLVTIDSIRVLNDIDLRPGHRPANHPHVQVSGVTVAGQAATIDDRGLHVAGTDGPSLERRVAAQGIELHAVGTQRTDTPSTGRGTAVGLALDIAIPVRGVPYVPNPLPPFPPPFDQIPALPGINANGTYVGHVTLGAVGAVAGVGTEADFDLPGLTSSTPTGSSPAPVSRPGAAAPPAATDFLRGVASAPGQSPPAVAPPTVLRRFTDALSKRQVEVLYGVLALGTAGLFLGWRGAALLRHRSARP